VLTLASEFGDESGKEGEIEVVLHMIDARLLVEAMRETGGSKARTGSYFAAGHPQLTVGAGSLKLLHRDGDVALPGRCCCWSML
jgi:hypothetical protein